MQIRGERAAARETAELLGKLASSRTTHGTVLHIIEQRDAAPVRHGKKGRELECEVCMDR
jgi:hypothetical protein